MNTFHINLQHRWKDLSINEQMANIGAEVGRSINWKKKGNLEMSMNAFYRTLELKIQFNQNFLLDLVW